MPKVKQEFVNRASPVNELREQLNRLTAQLKEHQLHTCRCTFNNCQWASDALRLSQEVDILQKQIDVLRQENEALKYQLSRAGTECQTGAALFSRPQE